MLQQTWFQILATNIIETSVTIPTVNFVVDLLLRNNATEFTANGLWALKASVIERANVLQRKGRTGRCADGHYIAITSAHEFTTIINNTHGDQKLTSQVNTEIPTTHMLVLAKAHYSVSIMRDKYPFALLAEVYNETLRAVRQLGMIEYEEEDEDEGYIELSAFGLAAAGIVLLPPELSVLLLAERALFCYSDMETLSALLTYEMPRESSYSRFCVPRIAYYSHHTSFK